MTKRGWFPVQAATAIIDAGAVQLYNPNSAVSFRNKSFQKTLIS